MDLATPQTIAMRDVVEFLDTNDSPLSENTEDFIKACNVAYCWANLGEEGFTIRPLHTWNCHDQEVGFKVIYLEGSPVCTSYQSGRRDRPEYEWVSREAFEKTRARILLIAEKGGEGPDFIDLSMQIPIVQKFESLDAIVHGEKREAIYNGERVDVLGIRSLRRLRRLGVSPYAHPHDKEVIIRVNGEERMVNVADLDFPLRLRP